jgi:hypothetical protein
MTEDDAATLRDVARRLRETPDLDPIPDWDIFARERAGRKIGNDLDRHPRDFRHELARQVPRPDVVDE